MPVARTVGIIVACGAIPALGGCAAPRVEIRLDQPELTGSQRRMTLTGERAFWAADDSSGRLLLECPLPGSREGPPQFVVYVRLPARTGSHSVGKRFGDSDSDVVSGFLLQLTGRMRGLSPFVMGEIIIEDLAAVRGRLRVKCADRTEIRGRFVGRRVIGRRGTTLLRFEEAHAADIVQSAQVAADAGRQLAGQ